MKEVRIEPTAIADVLLCRTSVYRDARGYFTELYNVESWSRAGFRHAFVQDNLSLSSKGTLRGLHYQLDPFAQGKLVRVLRGAVFDVAVDLRQGSPTFGRWVGQHLNGHESASIWVPPGFGHGFLALEDDTTVAYKCTHVQVRQAERALFYDDPALAIDWPIAISAISDKDAQAPMLADAEINFVWESSDAGVR